MAELTTKTYLDLAGLQSYDEKLKAKVAADIKAVDDKVKTNTTDIGTLDAAIKENAGNIAANTANIALNKASAEAAAQAAATAQAEVDAVESIVADMYTNEQIDAAIEAAKTTATYDDTKVKEDIAANAEAISDNTEAIDALAEVVEGKADKATTLAGYGITDAYTKTEADTAIAKAVADSKHLKREIVTSLPAIEETDENTIYMIAKETPEGETQAYNEFMVINGVWEKIGDTAVDLTDYAKTADVTSAIKVETDRAVAAEEALQEAIDNIDVSGDIDAAIAELDAEISGTSVVEGGTDGVTVTVTEVDGKLTNVAVAANFANTYEAKGAASTAKEEAKTYTDTEVKSVYDSMSSISESDISALFAE